MAETLVKYADLSKVGPNLINISAVTDSIVNIIFTKRGSLPNKREFGSDTERHLFKPYSIIVARQIYADLKYSITRWDPRVEILPQSDVLANPDTRTYNLVLHIKIKGFPEPFVYEKELQPKGNLDV